MSQDENLGDAPEPPRYVTLTNGEEPECYQEAIESEERQKGDKPTLVGYSNSDMAGDIDSRKSTSDYLINFVGGTVAWQSKLQKCVALFTTKVEFIIITEACKELLWVKKFLQKLGFVQDKHCLFCDSHSVIHLGKISFHSKSKHIDVRYHWICDALDAKLLKLIKVPTDDNGVDMMTKAIPRGKFEACEIAGLFFPINNVLKQWPEFG
ncbi:hypothetical protein CR513_13261, partial [Mucuna pruriens]